MDVLFTPPYIHPDKRLRTLEINPALRDSIYEHRLNQQIVYGRRRKGGVDITPQQAADILTNNGKVSADGSINTHSDVETNNPSVNEILSWNGTNWTNIPNNTSIENQILLSIINNNEKVSADGSINTHSDVETNNPSVNETLSWNGTNWTNVPAIIEISAQQITDIQTSNLKISADGSINAHDDVQTQNISEGDLLSWSYPNWVNIPGITGITPQQTADIQTNNLKVSADGSINTHNDVETISPSPGDLLSWNGTNWVSIPSAANITIQQATDIQTNNSKISAGGSINTHSDIETSNVMTNDAIYWNGLMWKNVNLNS